MSYGVIEYDEAGKPKCEVCGKHFSRPLVHASQKHELSEKEYKEKFGFDSKKGICSKGSAEKSRLKIMENYEKCIQRNLLIKGSETRFKDGNSGKDTVSEQTRLRLKARLKEPYMVAAMKEAGKVVGNSGTGNLKRWNK